MLSDEQMREWEEIVRDCGCIKARCTPCDSWGCCVVSALLAEVQRLRAALAEHQREE